jgi:enoyl-CoA hydratase/carnithine racemase
MVDANEALAIGLVNRIVPHEHLLPEAWSLAHAIAAHQRAALLRTKNSYVGGCLIALCRNGSDTRHLFSKSA